MADNVIWSPGQKQIIDQRKGNLLVSAAAGAGKTAVLVERILHIVTESDRTDLSRLLIVTFTRMAANQMKERIMKRLMEMASENPDNSRLQYLVTQVPESQIMTIDAFCLSILKRYITRVPDLDPSFRNADEQELEMLGMDILSDTLSDAYDEWELHPDSSFSVCFDAMLKQFSGTRQDLSMEPLLYSIYRYSCSFPDPEGWIHRAVEDHRDYPVYQAMLGLEEILKRFRKNFREERSRRNVVGFSDIESLTADILLNEDGKPSPEARCLSEEIDYIFIDEYQDSNDLQEKILQSIAKTNEEGQICNIFMVGDVKQSIYGFRGTSSELFESKMKTYLPYEEGKNSKIFLQTNYRSRPEILSGINYFFESLMTEENTGIDYNQGQSLEPGRPETAVPENVESFEPQLVVLNKNMAREGEENLDMEARWVADEIAAMLEDAAHYGVTDKNGQYRPLQAQDIVILLRSPGQEAPVFLKALEERKIPCSASVSISFLDSPEIRLAVSILRCIDNLQQDIPLFALLHSPVGELSSQELAILRLQAGRELRFHEVVTSFAEAHSETLLGRKLQTFLQKIHRWRSLSRILSLEELLMVLYDESGLNQYILTMTNPQQRRANLNQLLKQAKTFEEGIYTGVFQFVRFLDRMKERDKDYEEAKVPSEPNAVQILSIHKSKGLEFPVVFVSRLGKNFNLKDAQTDPLLHAKAGIGFQFMDENYPVKLDNPHRSYVAQQITQDLYKEELRVLYVAMTRAKERLILCGALEDKKIQELSAQIYDRESPLETENTDFRLSQGEFLGCRSYLSWLTKVFSEKCGRRVKVRFEEELQDEEATEDLLEDIQASGETVESENSHELQKSENSRTTTESIAVGTENFHELQKTENSQTTTEPISVEPEQGVLDRLLLWQYPHAKRNRLPILVSVSALKASTREEEEKEVDWNQLLTPVYRDEEEPAFSGARGGTLFHEVLARCDLEEIQTVEGREKTLHRMVEATILTEKELAAFPMEWLEDFAISEVCHKMMQAKVLLREENFLAGFSVKELQQLVPEFFASELGTLELEDEILVQGILDAAYLEEDGWVIVDYKTDRKLDEAHLRMYGLQLKLYAIALERSKNARVKGLTLYEVRKGKEIKMDFQYETE